MSGGGESGPEEGGPGTRGDGGASAVRIVFSTFPDPDSARAAARVLVDDGLAACGNVFPGLTSVFRWEGAVEEEGEAFLLLKSSEEVVAALRERLVELHPYDLPEVLAFEVTSGHSPYIEWILESCAGGRANL